MREYTQRGKKKKKTAVSPPEVEWTVYYDGSERDDIQQGGSGCVLLEKGEEIGGDAMTIPYGTNNMREFSIALLGIKLAKKREVKRLAVVGDCKILIEIMRKKGVCKDLVLEKIRIMMREWCGKFEEVIFHHVMREFNKRADVIAFTMAMSQKAVERAVEDPNWEDQLISTLERKSSGVVMYGSRWRRGVKTTSSFQSPRAFTAQSWGKM